jgi:hypothetical protein
MARLLLKSGVSLSCASADANNERYRDYRVKSGLNALHELQAKGRWLITFSFSRDPLLDGLANARFGAARLLSRFASCGELF